MIYTVMDRDGHPHIMTARSLYKRIREDSERSNYNWLASATELTRVTHLMTLFGDDYIIDIRTAILNCFASIEHQGNCSGDYYYPRETDRIAVQECYNSLHSIKNNELATAATKRYLTEMITAATRPEDAFEFLAHPGQKFHDFRNEWIKDKCAEYYEKDCIDFKEMLESIRLEWRKLKKEAEDRGDFEADDDAERERIFGFISSRINLRQD